MDVLRSKILRDLKNLAEDKAFLNSIRKVDEEALTSKTCQISEKLKDRGSKLLAKGNHDNKQLHTVLTLYNESIARAPIGSEEMAKTYANKSALLYDMRKYNQSITEADKALKITNLIFLKVKLWCRKAECLTALGSLENRSCLEKARFILNKSEDLPMIKEMLKKFIEDAQTVINEGKLDKPRENKRLADVSKIVANEGGKDIWKSVEIKYNEKYGRHAVAARDFEPGEIILIEKPYLYYVRELISYQYCSKCFKYLWTVVPCNQCCWRLFCSEECRNEAWNQYHDVECSVISKMKFAFSYQWNEITSIFLCIFFKSLKDAGSIDQLLIDFKSPLCQDQSDGYLDYKTILASKFYDVEQEESRYYLHNAVLGLIGLAKFTKIFGKCYDFTEIKELMKNEKAVDVGCLLLKFGAVIGTGCVTVKLLDSTVQSGSYEEIKEEFKKGDIDWRSVVFSLMTMQTLRGCIPNVETGRTFGYRTIMFAIAPIKAGTPLTLFNRSPSVYKNTPKNERQASHQELYKCLCDCRACKETWPENLDNSMEGLNAPGINHNALMRFMDEYESIVRDWHSHMQSHKPSYPDLKVMTRANNCARDGWKIFPIPSSLMKMCTLMLVDITNFFHSPDKNLFTTS